MVNNNPASVSSQRKANVSGSSLDEKALPKDAQVITSILKDMGLVEYEPRVVNQLLEFSYRYISTILEDAKIFSSHARKTAVDLDDVKLAVQMYTDHNLTNPPPRDLLFKVAAERNAIPLPVPKQTGGLRLPPDRFCLTATNYRLKPSRKKGPGSRSHTASGSQGGYVTPQTVHFSVNAAGKIVSSNGPLAGGTPKFSVKPLSNKMTAIPGISSGTKANPTASIKLSTPPSNTAAAAGISLMSTQLSTKQNEAAKIQIQPGVSTGASGPIFSMIVNPPSLNSTMTTIGVKRKADQMENSN